jgi:hypothetical protein
MIKLTCRLAFAGFSAMPLVAQAQSYPSRSITVVVPFPAGGPSDVVARVLTRQSHRRSGPGLASLGLHNAKDNTAGLLGTRLASDDNSLA